MDCVLKILIIEIDDTQLTVEYYIYFKTRDCSISFGWHLASLVGNLTMSDQTHCTTVYQVGHVRKFDLIPTCTCI